MKENYVRFILMSPKKKKRKYRVVMRTTYMGVSVNYKTDYWIRVPDDWDSEKGRIVRGATCCDGKRASDVNFNLRFMARVMNSVIKYYKKIGYKPKAFDFLEDFEEAMEDQYHDIEACLAHYGSDFYARVYEHLSSLDGNDFTEHSVMYYRFKVLGQHLFHYDNQMEYDFFDVAGMELIKEYFEESVKNLDGDEKYIHEALKLDVNALMDLLVTFLTWSVKHHYTHDREVDEYVISIVDKYNIIKEAL